MGLQAIGSSGFINYQLLNGTSGTSNAPPQATPANSQSSSLAPAPTSGQSVEQQFLNYMKESPGQRMIDAWLKAHHLTEQSLAAMPPAQRNAILKQMADDIKNEVKQKAEAKMSANTNILV